MNKQRKAKLRERALAHAEDHALDGVGVVAARFGSFQAGYRAAMRDARKARQRSLIFKRHDAQLWCIDEFLRPLR